MYEPFRKTYKPVRKTYEPFRKVYESFRKTHKPVQKAPKPFRKTYGPIRPKRVRMALGRRAEHSAADRFVKGSSSVAGPGRATPTEVALGSLQSAIWNSRYFCAFAFMRAVAAFAATAPRRRISKPYASAFDRSVSHASRPSLTIFLPRS